MATLAVKSLFSTLIIPFMMIVFITAMTCSATLAYNIVNYGARPGYTTDSSQAFVTAWNLACNESKQAATLYVPHGDFLLLKSVTFQGPCKSSNVTIRIDGTLVAPSDYSVIGDNKSWLYFKYVNGVTIIGGTLDGQGKGLWDCKMSGKRCPEGATVCVKFL